MSAAFLAGLVAGYGVAVPVGAIAILIAGLTARTSLRVGVAAALGVATADGLYAAAAVTGGAALAGIIAPVAAPLRWIAAAVLIGLAAITAITAVRRHRDPVRGGAGDGITTPIRAYGGILALTLLNPMTVVYFGALVLARQASGDLPPPAAAAFVAGAFLASASWQLLIAAGGSLIGRLLTGRRGRLATALLSAVLITALAIHTLAG